MDNNGQYEMWTDKQVDEEIRVSFRDGIWAGILIGGCIFGIVGAIGMFLAIWFVTV